MYRYYQHITYYINNADIIYISAYILYIWAGGEVRGIYNHYTYCLYKYCVCLVYTSGHRRGVGGGVISEVRDETDGVQYKLFARLYRHCFHHPQQRLQQGASSLGTAMTGFSLGVRVWGLGMRVARAAAS